MDKNYSVHDDEFWKGLIEDIKETEKCIRKHEETDMLMYEFSDELPELRSELEMVIRNIPMLRDMAEGCGNKAYSKKSEAEYKNIPEGSFDNNSEDNLEENSEDSFGDNSEDNLEENSEDSFGDDSEDNLYDYFDDDMNKV